MKPQRLFLSFMFLMLIGTVVSPARADITLEAALSHLSFAVDQGTMLTVTVNGASRVTSIEVPEVVGLRFHNRGQSSRINIVNGEMSSSLTHSYLIQAEKPGTYTIPPIKVTAGRETGVTKSLSFEVTASGASATTGTTRSDEEAAFIRLEVEGDHYPGEIVPVRIKAYFNQRFKTDINSLPSLKGEAVAMPQLREKPQQSEERQGGVAYHVLSWDTTLSGLKVGKHSISLAMEASLIQPQRRRQLSPFGGSLFDDPLMNDPFFDNFFGGVQRKPITVRSPEVIFSVIPLPGEGRPENFSGAIGDFTLKVSADRGQLEVGEPLKLAMEISGQGNFERIDPPSFPEGQTWKTYAPTSSFVENGNSYTGSKTFEMAVVARDAGAKEIPPLSFSFFHPGKKSYVTVNSPPLPVEIKGGAVAAGTTTASPVPPSPPPSLPTAAAPSQEPPPATGMQLAPTRLDIGTVSPEIMPVFRRPWFLGLAGLALALLLFTALVEWRRRHTLQHPEKAARQRQQAVLADDLRRCREACDGGDSNGFLAAAKSTVQHRLGAAWQLPAEAISSRTVEERLGREAPLLAIFTAADAALYGGSTLSREEMEQTLSTLQKALEDVP
jgi:BatD DUF11 like domain